MSSFLLPDPIKKTSLERPVFNVFSAITGELLYSLTPAFDEGQLFFSPLKSLLLVYSTRRFLGDTDHQIDIYEAASGRYLHGLYNVPLADLSFSPDESRIYQRQLFTAPSGSHKEYVGNTLILDAHTGFFYNLLPDDGQLHANGRPILQNGQVIEMKVIQIS